jgi:hypothetical protein
VFLLLRVLKDESGSSVTQFDARHAALCRVTWTGRRGTGDSAGTRSRCTEGTATGPPHIGANDSGRHHLVGAAARLATGGWRHLDPRLTPDALPCSWDPPPRLVLARMGILPGSKVWWFEPGFERTRP